MFLLRGFWASFFYYLQSNLESFFEIVKDPCPFFAGLFDAEGNVSLYNKSFRWACKNEDLIKIYSKYLRKINLFDRYDGCCLISYNKKVFHDKIIPHMKHNEKINSALFLCCGNGKTPKNYSLVLDYIRKNPNKTAKGIAKALKKNKVYSELSLLKEFDFILSKGYPQKFKLNDKKKS